MLDGLDATTPRDLWKAEHHHERPVSSRAVSARTDHHAIVATVILPAYNEAVALPAVLADLLAVLDDRYEVIVVDDASTDESVAIASRYPCRVLRHERNRGKGAAVRTGLMAAQGRFIIVMDADNTYPADAIPQMVTLSEEYDFVRCTRQEVMEHMPLVNRIGNRIFDFMLKTLHGLEGDDHLSGLYGLRRVALLTLGLTADRFDIEVEIGVKARAHQLRSTSLPITYGERLGEKKLRAWRDGWCILQRSVALALRPNAAVRPACPGAVPVALSADRDLPLPSVDVDRAA